MTVLGARPSLAVSLGAHGSFSPWPIAVRRARSTPLSTRNFDHRLGAQQRQLLVPVRRTGVVGVPLDGAAADLGVRLQRERDLAQDVVEGVAHPRMVGLEEDRLQGPSSSGPIRHRGGAPLSGQPSSSSKPLMVSGSLGHLSEASGIPSLSLSDRGSRPRPRSRPCPRARPGHSSSSSRIPPSRSGGGRFFLRGSPAARAGPGAAVAGRGGGWRGWSGGGRSVDQVSAANARAAGEPYPAVRPGPRHRSARNDGHRPASARRPPACAPQQQLDRACFS